MIDFVETPAKFRVAEINRNQAVAVGRKVFAALNRLEIALGALLRVVNSKILQCAGSVDGALGQRFANVARVYGRDVAARAGAKVLGDAAHQGCERWA